MWGVVSPLHAMVQLRELTHRQKGLNVCFHECWSTLLIWRERGRSVACDCTSDGLSGTLENVRLSHLRRVNAEVLKRIKSDEDVPNISVNLQLIISPLEVADYCLLQERRETCYKQHRSDRYAAAINTAKLTSSKNSRFTRSSSGQLSIMRVLRVLILSCLCEAKDKIMPQKAGKWPPNEKQ